MFVLAFDGENLQSMRNTVLLRVRRLFFGVLEFYACDWICMIRLVFYISNQNIIDSGGRVGIVATGRDERRQGKDNEKVGKEV